MSDFNFKKRPTKIYPMETDEQIEKSGLSSRREAFQYLSRLNQKTDLLAERFAKGKVNQSQFIALYGFYQSEIQQLELFLKNTKNGNGWQDVVNEGKSIIIRKRYAARLIGFSIYSNTSGQPLRTLGQFAVDPILFIPILHAYQNAAKEIFGEGMRSIVIKDGHVLIFMPGYFSTTLALYTAEPSAEKIKQLEKIHKTFELANERELVKRKIEPDKLVLPHQCFL